MVGVGSSKLSKTLMRPLFSATKTRPSEANWTTVGWAKPVIVGLSWNPGVAVVNDQTTDPGMTLPARSRAPVKETVYV